MDLHHANSENKCTTSPEMDHLMETPKDKKLLFLCYSLSCLVVFSAFCGLRMESTYILETPNWRIQGIGQDLVDLFLVTPVLLISGIQAYRQKKRWFFIFGGTVLFLAYTYAIYCFALHFNALFLVYCLSFGLSVYSFIYFIWKGYTRLIISNFDEKLPVKSIGLFLIGSAVSFCFLWLSEIIPAIVHHQVPASLAATGAMTNPVHVLDLSLFLPALFLDGILLMKKNAFALVLTPALLVFSVLMDLDTAGLVIYMYFKGAGTGLAIPFTMTGMAVISAYLLNQYFRHITQEARL
jgi:hypothetical protein